MEINRILRSYHKTHYDEIFGNGIDHEFIISHSLDSKILMAQIINSKTGIELDKNDYILIRNSNNTVLVQFKNIPKKEESYYVMLLRMD